MRLKHVPEPPESNTVSPNDETSDPDTDAGTAADESNLGANESASTDGAANAVEPASVQVAVDAVADAQSAVPLVPGSETDCCARLQRRVGYPSRDVARTWLTFLRGLGYAEETDRGFRRTREEPTADGVRRGLPDGVLGARELADALLDARQRADDSDADDASDTDDTTVTPAGVDADEAFAAVSEAVPRWERTRTDDWKRIWRERTNRLLGWFHALGLARVVVETNTSGADASAASVSTARSEYRATTVLVELRDETRV